MRLSTTLPVCCGVTRQEAQRREASLGEPGARLLRAGVTGTPADVLAALEGFAAAGLDTVYFHIYDPEDLDHIRLLGQEVLARLKRWIENGVGEIRLSDSSANPTVRLQVSDVDAESIIRKAEGLFSHLAVWPPASRRLCCLPKACRAWQGRARILLGARAPQFLRTRDSAPCAKRK